MHPFHAACSPKDDADDDDAGPAFSAAGGVALPETVDELRAACEELARTLEEKERDLVRAGELGQALLANYDNALQDLDACRQQACLRRTALLVVRPMF